MTPHPPFWIEIIDKSGTVVSRQRNVAEAITIGRGYENDLVIDDAFVAPVHLRIAYEQERGVDGLWLEDLATQNGTFDVIRQANVKRLLVGDEASVRIGHTGLRVRRASFEVPPALPMAAAYSPRRQTPPSSTARPCRSRWRAVANRPRPSATPVAPRSLRDAPAGRYGRDRKSVV